MDVLDYLQKKAKIVNKEIDKLVKKDTEPKKLSKANRHLIEAGGKRLRPVLTITSAEAVGGISLNTLESAAAIEVLHTFTLIHDDIMDKDGFRRGTKTVHKTWDDAMAIIAGDALFAKVFEGLTKNAKSQNLESEKIIQLFDTVSKASYRICQGQALDIEFEKRKKVRENEYLEMVEKKTGALIEASTKIGAILGGGSDKEIKALAEYGRLLGIAFQIHDDYLGICGEQEKVGKPIGSDIQEGKWTFLMVHSYEKASDEDRKTLLKILEKEKTQDEEIEKTMKILEKTKTLEFAKNKARKLVEKAKKELEILPESESKDFLLELADFSIKREL